MTSPEESVAQAEDAASAVFVDRDAGGGGNESPPMSGQSSTSSSSLDLRSEHFFQASNPIGAMSSLESVSEAIEAAKSAAADVAASTDARKQLVDKLIRLRIRQQDLLEREDQVVLSDGEDLQGVLEVRGHRFVRYSRAAAQTIPWTDGTKKLYCDRCCGVLWLGLQSSRHCLLCGHSLHERCLMSNNNSALFVRPCVAEKAKTNPDFILTICPEKSLPRLKFRCVECDCLLSRSDPAREPRLCDYTGLSFCPSCHWNAQMPSIPARVVRNWDFDPRPVSQAAKQYLVLMKKKPVINISAVNPKLFAAVQEMNTARALREKIVAIKRYLVVCRLAAEAKVLLCLSSRQHFVDGSEFYSLQDLEDVKSGKMEEFLKDKIQVMVGHIRSCVLCRAKGFICELCSLSKRGRRGVENDVDGDDDQVTCCAYVSVKPEGPDGATGAAPGELLFPFDEDSAECPDCLGVFHRECFRQAANGPQGCPRCRRKKEKKKT